MNLCNFTVYFSLISLATIGKAVKNEGRLKRHNGDGERFVSGSLGRGSGSVANARQNITDIKSLASKHDQSKRNVEESSGSEYSDQKAAFPPSVNSNDTEEQSLCNFNVCSVSSNLCEADRICIFRHETCQAMCVCHEDAEDCETNVSEMTSIASGDVSQDDMASGYVPFTGTQNAPKDYIRPNFPRQEMLSNHGCLDSRQKALESCPYNFPCVHGECIIHHRGNEEYDIFCRCAPGWTGFSCDTCCNLDCKHGNCEIMNESMICACNFGYSGDLCQYKTTPGGCFLSLSDCAQDCLLRAHQVDKN